jgi:hypothetical protein
VRYLTVGLAAFVIATCASGAGGEASATQLRALLARGDVSIDRGTMPPASAFPAAWKTFQRFTRMPDGRHGSGLLFEYGVFESHFWGTSFEVELTRERVHLLVHFPVAAFISITRNLRAAPCLPGGDCDFRCFFAGDDALVPHPCRVVPQTAGGYRVGDMTLSGPEAGGRTRWIKAVESSPVFRALLTRHVRPDGFEVWQE